MALAHVIFGLLALASPDQNTRIYEKGALYGVVVDARGKPVKDATVALQRRDGKILGWCITDEEGEYAIPVDPKVALNLYNHHKSLLEQCGSAVSDVAMMPVRAVASVVTRPGPAVRSAAASVATGSPAPLMGHMASGMGSPKKGSRASKDPAGAPTYTALGGTEPPPPPSTVPGQASILVSADGFKSAQYLPNTYWMADRVKSKTMPIGLQAWVETVRLSPANTREDGEVMLQAITISRSTVEPKIVPAGKSVTIRCTVYPSLVKDRPIRVFARENKKDTVVELMQEADGRTYSGILTIDPKAGEGESSISIGALRADPVEVSFDPRKPDPLPEFCRRVDEMSADKPYAYDPLTMASVNREDLRITILRAAPSRG